MAQYTNTFTAQNGTVTNSVLNTVTNTQTITVTAPTGQVATATVDPTDVNSNLDNIITNLARQLNEGGGDIGLRGIVQGVQSTSESVAQQQQTATGVSRVTGNPPPAFTQPIPAQTIADPQVPQPADTEQLPTATATASVGTEDPFEAARLAAEEQANQEPAELSPADVGEEDPFEAARLEREQELNREQLAVEATEPEAAQDPYAVATEETEGPTEADLNVNPLDDEALAALDEQQQANRDLLASENFDPEPVDPEEDPFERARQDAEDAYNAEGPTEADLNVDPQSDEAILAQQEQQAANREALRSEDAQNAASEAAFRQKAKEQATFQARYKQPGNQDWRVRLSLGPNAKYLYNAGTPQGSAAGILAPLAATDGVIFPYTPSITTTYSANYEQYDLVHSNYRGVFYKNSRVGDISIRGTFTAQDTAEANYLLAVIHFFRSATKMFYGQDPQRGTPPPVCLLNGLGQYQFSDHPVVISSFNYTTPNDVDYIRALNPNNYGSNLLNRRSAVASNPGGSSLAGAFRLVNALLPKGAKPQTPNQSAVTGSVTNNTGATYVPTKIEIDITLIPVQTRSQVSKQFSLENFANGQGLKGGFW